MAGCPGRQLQSIANPHSEPQNGSLWSKTESRVLLSAILAASTSSSCDQRDGESWNYDWNAIQSHCQQQGVHKEVRELRQQWKKLQEDYAKLANDHHRSAAEKANVVQQIDPSNDTLLENIDVEIYDAIQSILWIAGNQSAPPTSHPTFNPASCKHLIHPCQCTQGSAPPVSETAPPPASSPSPSPSPAPSPSKSPQAQSGQNPPKSCTWLLGPILIILEENVFFQGENDDRCASILVL